MRKIIITCIFLIFLLTASVIIILSTIGIKTDKFNNIISDKINQSNQNTTLKIDHIKFKLDIKEVSLFLDILNPEINYDQFDVPTKNIRVYVDFITLFQSNPKITKISIVFDQIQIKQLKQLSKLINISNIREFINNKLRDGILISEIDLYFDEDNAFKDFIAKGSVTNLEVEIANGLQLKKTKFNFFADRADILLKKIYGDIDFVKIIDGDLKIKLSSDILLESNFKTEIKYKKSNSLAKKINLIQQFKHLQDISNFDANLDCSLLINFNKEYEIKNFDFKNTGKIIEAIFNFQEPIANYLSNKTIKKVTLKNSKIKTKLGTKENYINILGKYSFNENEFLSLDLENIFKKDYLNLKLNLEYNEGIELDIINYKKPEDSIANLSINLEKQKNFVNIKKINFKEKNNLFTISDLKLNKNKFSSIKKILVKTEDDGKIKNDFMISFGKNILIKGSRFDASKLTKIFSKSKPKNIFSNITKNIEVDLTNVIAPLSKDLSNFKLLGEIEKGKFIKISSKGDYGDDKFLDISMTNDKKNKKKYLEIYSDLSKPLLTEYSFFNGLTGGILTYSAIIEFESINSKLKIENFKVINAPGMIKLLSLADLGGLEDLAKGDGLSFDTLEISMSKKKNILKLNEILALGPSISVLMEGYQDQNGLTSLRGTLVPAKTLNKIISKIPLIGDLVIPKEVGEGLFGISFKMKGAPGEIKTTINPIRTLTPRFIQKILDKNNKPK